MIYESDHPDVPGMKGMLLRSFRKVGQEEIALLEKQRTTEALVQFLRDYAEEGPAWARFEDRGRRAMARPAFDLAVASYRPEPS